jgi:transposase
MESAAQIIIEMRNKGFTRQQIADALGLNKVQIKNWINRKNRQQRKIPSIPKQKGRPHKTPKNEPQSMALRIQELEREVELYRSFLQVAGRM